MQAIQHDQPELIISSPPCTVFSVLQKMNEAKWRGNENKEYKRKKAWRGVARHVKFCVELYKYQMKNGRRFLHVHPLGATSWALRAMQSLRQDSRITQIKADMCRFGMSHTESDGEKILIKKPTRFMTNSRGIAHELDKRCEGGHAHCHLVTGRATGAEVYPEGLRRAIYRGLKRTWMRRSQAWPPHTSCTGRS